MWRSLHASVLAAAICYLNIGIAKAAEHNAQAIRDTSISWTSRATDEQLPSCAQTCLKEILPQQDCTVDASCYCENKIANSLEKCMTSSCELPTYLSGQKTYSEICDRPVRDKTSESRRLNWSMFVIATVFVFGRFLGRLRYLGGSGYGWDDCESTSTFRQMVVFNILQGLHYLPTLSWFPPM